MRVFLPLKKTEKNNNTKSSSAATVSATSTEVDTVGKDTDDQSALQEGQAASGVTADFAVAAVDAAAVAEVETCAATGIEARTTTQSLNHLAVDPFRNHLPDTLLTSCVKVPPLACQKVEDKEKEKETKPAPTSLFPILSTSPLQEAAQSTNAPENAFPSLSAHLVPPPQIQSALSYSSLTSTSTSTGNSRKRRSFSPFDCKPASKKNRDCKPPARETKPKSTPTINTVAQHSTQSSSISNNNNNITMAGGSSRGSRQARWNAGGRSSPSYCVENSAGSSLSLSVSAAGSEEMSNSSSSAQENAPVLDDHRYNNNNYRHENDPASARGDVPTTSVLHVLPAAAAAENFSSSKVASSLRHSAHCHENSNGDDDVRDTTSAQQELDAVHRQFALALKKQGLEIVEQAGDGNCLFRAISLQVYGDASTHLEVRHRCLDFMSRDKEHFSQFITDEPFEQYIGRKRKDGVHGNNPEIQAISELFNRPIEVYVPENGASPLNIFHAEYKTADAPIRLSYHDGNHYNAVIDPLVPTAGLGLGLPGLQPGLADKMQMAKAVRESDRLADQTEFERALEESENDQLQRVIKESSLTVDHMFQNKAMSLSDCDATNFELEQAVLESSLESFRTFDHGQKKASFSGKSAGERRKRQAIPPQQETKAAAAGHATSSVASMPSEARQDSSISPIPGAASLASASAAAATAVAPAVASRPSNDDISSYAHSGAEADSMMAEQYPQSVQELVMNGFELKKVVHAYELVGDNFDNLLGFLMSTSSS